MALGVKPGGFLFRLGLLGVPDFEVGTYPTT